MATFKDKECKLCGTNFTPTNARQIYCKECGKDSTRIRQKMSIYKYKTDKMYNGLKVKICPECGNEFKTEFDRKFCTKKCADIHIQKRTECSYCGVNFFDKNIPMDHYGHRYHFCCEEHKIAYKSEQNIRKYGIKICLNCGKEYSNANKKFCSQECDFTYLAAHKIEKKPKEKTKPIQIKCKCIVCGTVSVQSETLGKEFICSPACREKHMENQKKQNSNENFRKYVEKNGLCGICCVAYSKCERMSSNFTKLPENAVLVDNKILECLRFKTKQKF